MIVNAGGIWCKVSGAVVWKVTGVQLPLFSLSELPEEGLDDAWAEMFGLVCVRGVIDGTVAVLELGVTEMGG